MLAVEKLVISHLSHELIWGQYICRCGSRNHGGRWCSGEIDVWLVAAAAAAMMMMIYETLRWRMMQSEIPSCNALWLPPRSCGWAACVEPARLKHDICRQTITASRKLHHTLQAVLHTPWTIKSCHFVFDYTSGFSWSIFKRKQEAILYKKLIKFTTSP